MEYSPGRSSSSGRHRVPANAVPCPGTDATTSACYLGRSVYGDGICDEGVGMVDVEEGLLHLIVRGEKSVCPFFQFLTVEGGQRQGTTVLDL